MEKRKGKATSKKRTSEKGKGKENRGKGKGNMERGTGTGELGKEKETGKEKDIIQRTQEREKKTSIFHFPCLLIM